MEIRLKTPFRPVPISNSEPFPRYSRFKIPRFQPNFAHSIKLTQIDRFRAGTLVYSKIFSARPQLSPTVYMLPVSPAWRTKFLNGGSKKYFLKLCPEHPPFAFPNCPHRARTLSSALDYFTLFYSTVDSRPVCPHVNLLKY